MRGEACLVRSEPKADKNINRNVNVIEAMNIDKLNLAAMWWETNEGVILECDPLLENVPSVEEYPLAGSCFPREVITTHYHRRESDGLYGTDQRLCAFHSGWWEDLALALATGVNGQKKYRLGDAINIASKLCERCMNAAAHQYGVEGGYPEFSEQWHRAGTSCKACRTETLSVTPQTARSEQEMQQPKS